MLRESSFLSAGLTLLECLMALVILMILVGIAIPSFQHWIAGSRAAATLNQLISALYTARSLAIERGSVVSLCASANGEACGEDWSAGQLIFLDPNHQGKPASPESRLRVFGPVPGNGKLQWRGFPKRAVIQFLPNGFPRDQNGTFYYCPDTNDLDYARAVILSKSGRVRVSNDTDGEGKPLSCS